MQTEYDNFPLTESDPMMTSRAEMDAIVAASTHSDPYGVFSFLGHPSDSRWAGGSSAATSDSSYTLTVLSDPNGSTGDSPHREPHLYHHHHAHHYPYHQMAYAPSWEQHGPAHHTSDECAVSGSDGAAEEPESGSSSSPERRCVKSLLHVALQRGSGFAQQFNSCGVPSIKQEYVSSTSPLSPRPLTPADSLRSYSPGGYASSPGYPASILPPTSSPAYPSSVITSTSAYAAPSSSSMPTDDAAVSTTSSLGYSPVGYPSSPMQGYSAFRAPFPTPSPQPSYASTIVPLPMHLLPTVVTPFSEQTTPPPTPTATTASKKRRSRANHQTQSGGAPPKRRERSERQLHPCTLCEKRFKDNYSVNVHMRTHTGEKPFPCIVCGKMFRQKAHLAKHRSTHQASEYARLENQQQQHQQHSPQGSQGHQLGSLDNNGNSLPLWSTAIPETKCKTNSLWTPSVISAPVRTVQ